MGGMPVGMRGFGCPEEQGMWYWTPKLFGLVIGAWIGLKIVRGRRRRRRWRARAR